MMVREFGYPLDWETVERALALLNFEIKQLALWRRLGCPQDRHAKA